MKTIAGLACILGFGLAACATGSTASDGDAGAGPAVPVGTPDAGPVVIVSSTSGAGTSTTPAADAGGIGVPSNGTGGTPDLDAGSGFASDDSGDGLGDGDDSGESDDSGSGDDSSGGDASFGDDSGYGDDSGGGTCEGYAYPETYAGCDCTANDPSECQANGCYNGYFCDTETEKCKASLPSGC